MPLQRQSNSNPSACIAEASNPGTGIAEAAPMNSPFRKTANDEAKKALKQDDIITQTYNTLMNASKRTRSTFWDTLPPNKQNDIKRSIYKDLGTDSTVTMSLNFLFITQNEDPFVKCVSIDPWKLSLDVLVNEQADAASLEGFIDFIGPLTSTFDVPTYLDLLEEKNIRYKGFYEMRRKEAYEKKPISITYPGTWPNRIQDLPLGPIPCGTPKPIDVWYQNGEPVRESRTVPAYQFNDDLKYTITCQNGAVSCAPGAGNTSVTQADLKQFSTPTQAVKFD